MGICSTSSQPLKIFVLTGRLDIDTEERISVVPRYFGDCALHYELKMKTLHKITLLSGNTAYEHDL